MNIFVLHHDPSKAAEYHCDRHVVKMTLETAQLLCGALHKNIDHLITKGQEFDEHIKECDNCKHHAIQISWDLDSHINGLLDFKSTIPYKATHKNHPSTVWTSRSSSNFAWLLHLGQELGKQYTKRYGKIHKSTKVFDYVTENVDDILELFETHLPTPPPLAMPDEHKIEGEVVESYRQYYIKEKSSFAKWAKGVEAPSWYTEQINIE